MKRFVWDMCMLHFCMLLIMNLITPVAAIYNNSTAMSCVLNLVETAVNEYSTNINVRDCHISVSELNDYFWDASAGTTYRDLIDSFTYKYNGNYVISMIIDYRFDRTSTNTVLTEFAEYSEELLDTIDDKMSDLDILFYLHNYLALHTEYDTEAANYVTSTGSTTVSSKYALSFSTVGPLVMGKAVCSGYSQSYLYLLSKLGIESKYLTSSSMNHGWNIVKYNGNWYHIDITYDDPVPDYLGYVDYKYFMMNSDEISEDHSWDDTTITSASTAMKASKYIFNQDIKDAYYYDGYWYYVKNHAIYKSKIDGSDSSVFYDGASVLNIAMNGNVIYYTTTSNGYYLNGIHEMNADLDYNVEVTSLKSATYVSGLFYEDGKLYVTKRTGTTSYFEVNDAITFESHLDSVYMSDTNLSGTVRAYNVHKGVEMATDDELQIMLDGTNYDLYFDLVDSGDYYTFSIPFTNLYDDTYVLKIADVNVIYDFLSHDSSVYKMEGIDNEVIEYADGKITVSGVDASKTVDLSPYSAMTMNVYSNSRVTSITETTDGFTVAGYMFENGSQNASYNDYRNWREIVFVNVADPSTASAYRKLVKPVYNTWLNSNMNATQNKTYNLSYANYTVGVDPDAMYAYSDGQNITPIPMAAGMYYVYMRISNGSTSYLFPLVDKTLSDGTNMESDGTLPEGFSVYNQSNRALMYTVQ